MYVGKYIHTLTTQILTHDFWGAHLWDVERATHKSHRPVTTLVWRIVCLFLGEVDPLYFRLLGCLGHTLTSILLLFTIRSVNIEPSKSSYCAIPVFLFASHPVHSENIVYCVGFADTLTTMFMLLAFKNSLSIKNRFIPGLLSLLASLSKESGFVSFLIVFLVRFFRDPKKVRNYLPELVVTVCFPLLRLWYVGGVPVNFAYVDVPYIYEPSWLIRALSYLHVHSIYGRLLVLPWNQSWDYSFDAVPLVKEVSDMRNMGSISAYLTLTWIGYTSFRSASSEIVIALSFFVLPFIPMSSLFLAVGTVVGERLLYPVSAGLSMLLALLIPSFASKTLLTLLVPVYIYLSVSRIAVWSSKFSLYSTDATAWPRSSKTLHQYGAVLMNRKDGGLDAALPVLEQSLKVFDDNALTDYLISQIYIEKGDYEKAIEIHNKIAQGHGIGFTDFSRFMFLVDAGYVLVADGRYGYEYPVNLIEEGLEIFGYVSHARNAAAVAYMHRGMYREAIWHLESAIMSEFAQEKSEILWSNLAVAFALNSQSDKAEDCIVNAIQLGIKSGHHPTVVNTINWLNGMVPEPSLELFYTRMT
jgi:hypothetical protein